MNLLTQQNQDSDDMCSDLFELGYEKLFLNTINVCSRHINSVSVNPVICMYAVLLFWNTIWLSSTIKSNLDKYLYIHVYCIFYSGPKARHGVIVICNSNRNRKLYTYMCNVNSHDQSAIFIQRQIVIV